MVLRDLTASKQTQIGSLDFANMTKTLTTLYGNAKERTCARNIYAS